MKFKYIKHALAVLIMTASGMVNAAVINIGNLTLENAGDIFVTDTLNGIDYMRWDQVKDLNFTQLSAKLASDPLYQGWSIATNVIANNFTNALLPNNMSLCNNVVISTRCNNDTPPVLFEYDKFVTLMGVSYDLNDFINLAFFLNPLNAKFNEVGYIEAYSKNETLTKVNSWSSIEYSDNYSQSGSASNNSIGFMLYRQSVDVPEPTTLAMFALGLIGLASRRFKK